MCVCVCVCVYVCVCVIFIFDRFKLLNAQIPIYLYICLSVDEFVPKIQFDFSNYYLN